MPPFKEIHWQFENLGFPDSEGKLLTAFGARAGGVDLVLVGFPSQFPFDNNPSSALGAGYARADDPIRHLIFSVNDFGWRKIPKGQVSQPSFSRAAIAIERAAECQATPRHPGPTA